jgi:hypothetical protein
MVLRPHIVHIVGHTEADHAATAEDIIEAARMARRAIENAMGQPDPSADAIVQERVRELVGQAHITLEAIRSIAPPSVPDPWIDADTLAKVVSLGIMDAPQLGNNPFARGELKTRIDRRGANLAVDALSFEPVSEEVRLARLTWKEQS